jgi:hypothetical protein
MRQSSQEKVLSVELHSFLSCPSQQQGSLIPGITGQEILAVLMLEDQLFTGLS